LAANPALRARLRATPHGFFRFVNLAFTREVCRRFKDLAASAPAVTLHGDCHLEQYAVTEIGRGLTDFDDSATGPAFVDIVRFGVSIHLAARERRWVREADGIYAAFRSGYRKALADPTVEAPEPQFARRVKAGFDYDRTACLARAEAFMETLPEHQPEVDEATRELTTRMLAQNAGLPPWFFRVKKMGTLRLGIGSALSAKYLVRIEGPTDADEDDLILEAKELVDRQSVGCLLVAPGPSRIFTGDARIAYQPFRFPGTVHIGTKTLWIHAWPDNYVELDIQQSLRSPGELREIAYDVGVQLGRGHPRGQAEMDEGMLRKRLLETLPEPRLRQAVIDLTSETLRAWTRFRGMGAPR
jgi:hypothetical protein